MYRAAFTHGFRWTFLAVVFLVAICSQAGAGEATATGLASKIVVPSFLDCTGEEHADWAHFRQLFQAMADKTEASVEHAEGDSFPTFDPELAEEAVRLYHKWADHMAVGIEDYPRGSAKLYHSCHWGESSSYCLYGHIAAIVYIARYSSDLQRRFNLATSALRLISWNHCLDFLESSSWSFSLLDLWDLTDGHQYPQVTLMHQHMEFGPGTGVVEAAGGNEESPTETNNFWIFEFGSHRALSNEPVTMLERAMPGYHAIHQNFVKPYKGQAEAFSHPFPRECSPNCAYQQESVPYTFPVFDDMAEARKGWQMYFNTVYLNKPEVRRASVFLCTNPIYHCSFFVGMNMTIVGYFGLPLLYMVPHADWDAWLQDFVALALSPTHIFFANNPLLGEQIVWQTGIRVQVLQPVVLHIKEVYYPSRLNDVLVPEPREACVLHCLIRAFTPASYPFSFFAKSDTDRTFRTFATFRAMVLYPHDVALMSFYEFYAMGIPLFMPSHLSKYIFPYSATVPLLDWLPPRLQSCSSLRAGAAANGPRAGSATEPGTAAIAACGKDRPTTSPLSLTSVAALRHWSRYMDFFNFPAVQLFPSIAMLLEMLPVADMHSITVAMRESHMERLVHATHVWRDTAVVALSDAAAALASS